MKISLLTDAPKHNLALMKISAWHKRQGDEVILNMPLWKADKTYASILFDWNRRKYVADIYGGVGLDVPNSVDLFCPSNGIYPDYTLFGQMDYSLGYTFRFCPRSCNFCKVSKVETDKSHHSIWEFHDSKFKKICLLNNNTFFDPQWKQTFEEIWDANLSVIDENGYDLRLLDDEKTDALKKTKFNGGIHFAWDRMEDEQQIIRGLKLLNKYHLRSTSNMVYILIGYDTTPDEDIYRCQVINDYGLVTYPMPFVKNEYTKRFKRFMNLYYYRNYPTIEKAWKQYIKGN